MRSFAFRRSWSGLLLVWLHVQEESYKRTWKFAAQNISQFTCKISSMLQLFKVPRRHAFWPHSQLCCVLFGVSILGSNLATPFGDICSCSLVFVQLVRAASQEFLGASSATRLPAQFRDASFVSLFPCWSGPKPFRTILMMHKKARLTPVCFQIMLGKKCLEFQILV